MSYSVGDGLVAMATAAGIVGWYWVRHQSRLKRLEIIHQERMAAMEKGIPLPEFPLELGPEARRDNVPVLPVLGMVLLTLSAGAMIVMWQAGRGWVAPLPFAFLGGGFIAFHLLKIGSER